MLDLDIETKEVVFTVDMKPSQWLAVGLASDFKEADVIWWEAGATGYKPEDKPMNMSEEVALRA